jgi:hypothetical protein|tara:strand:+ start:426 stop:830 length:405 start_codon:yes stop_codon:yes gene_type:complete
VGVVRNEKSKKMNDLLWEITNLDRRAVLPKLELEKLDRELTSEENSNIIIGIHYTVTHIDDKKNMVTKDQWSGKIKVKLGSNDIIPYNDVKESDCIAWLKHAIGFDDVLKIESLIHTRRAENAKKETTTSIKEI